MNAFRPTIALLILFALCNAIIAQEALPDDGQELAFEGDEIIEDRGSIFKKDPNKVAMREQNDENDISPENQMDFLKIFTGLYYHRTYEQINSYLVANVESTDAKSNFDAARQWLSELNQGMKKMMNSQLIKALQQFLSLQDVADGPLKCSKNGYAALFKNDKATGGKGRISKKELGPMKRIEWVVYQANLKHAQDCELQYPQLYAQRRASMDQAVVGAVESFVGDMIERHGDKTKLSAVNAFYNPNDVAKEIKKLLKALNEDFLHRTLASFARDDPDNRYLRKVVDEEKGKMVVRKDKVHELVKKYFNEPCKAYMSELGANIFIPFSYDHTMLGPEDRFSIAQPEVQDFYKGWVNYVFCYRILKGDYQSISKKISKAASKFD